MNAPDPGHPDKRGHDDGAYGADADRARVALEPVEPPAGTRERFMRLPVHGRTLALPREVAPPPVPPAPRVARCRVPHVRAPESAPWSGNCERRGRRAARAAGA